MKKLIWKYKHDFFYIILILALFGLVMACF